MIARLRFAGLAALGNGQVRFDGTVWVPSSQSLSVSLGQGLGSGVGMCRCGDMMLKNLQKSCNFDKAGIVPSIMSCFLSV